MSKNETNSSPAKDPAKGASSRGSRYALISLLAVLLFAVSYGIASGRNGSSASAGSVQPAGGGSASGLGALAAGSGSGSGSGSGAGSPGCACCGGAGSSTPIEGTAAVEGEVQRISVDLSTGSYDPNTIKLKAGVPTEVTFGQSSGCTAQVQSQDLNFFEDLTSGPKTVKLPALQPGEYQFSCGMQMVFGKFVVE